MPRITWPDNGGIRHRPCASMRPGRNAPDNSIIQSFNQPKKEGASMRPGRNAPDNRTAVFDECARLRSLQ